MKKIVVAALFLCVLTGAASWVLLTTSGLQWAVDRVLTRMPGTTRIDAVAGRLVGPILVHGVAFRVGDNSGTVDSLVLDWQPLRLFVGELAVTSFEVRDVHLETATGHTTNESAMTGTRPDFVMPFKLRIERASVSQLQIQTADGSTSEIDRMDVALIASGNRAEIQQFTIATGTGSLSARGGIPLGKTGMLDVATDWRVEVDASSFEGTGRVTGTLESPTLDQTLTAPFPASLHARLQTTLQTPRWQAVLAIPQIHLDDIFPGAPPILLNGTVTGTGGIDEMHAAATLSLENPVVGGWSAQGDIQWDGQTWTVPGLDLVNPKIGAKISARAEFKPQSNGTGPTLHVALDWHNLRWPPQATETATSVMSPDGSASLTGSPDDFRMSVAAHLDNSRFGRASITGAGHGDRNGFQLARFDMEWLAGAWQGSGSVQWHDIPQVALSLTAAHVNPGVIWANWSGNINASVDLNARRSHQGVELAMALHELDGDLRGQTIRARGTVSTTDEQLHVHDLHCTFGGTELRATIDLGDEWMGSWQFKADNLTELQSTLRGQLRGRGELHGTPQTPRFVTSIDGRNIALGERSIGRIAVETDLTLTPSGPMTVELNAANIALGHDTPFDLVLDANGTVAAHDIAIHATAADRQAFTLELQGGWEGDWRHGTWRGSLTGSSLVTATLGQWRQTSPTKFAASPRSVEMDQTCWRNEGKEDTPAEVCTDGAWRPSALTQLHLRVHDLPLHAIHDLAPQSDIRISGLLDGEARATIASDSLQHLEVDAQVHNGRVRYPLPSDGIPHTLNFARLDVSALGDAGRAARIKVRLELDDTQNMDVTLSLPGWDLRTPIAREQPVRGSLALRLQDLTPLVLWFPDIQATNGTVTANMSVRGTLAAPALRGQANLETAGLSLPRLGLDLQDVRIDGTVEGRNRWTMHASARSGGELRVDGSGKFSTPNAWTAELVLHGDDVEILRLPIANVFASPEIRVSIRPQQVAVDGTLTIPKAKINFVSPDVTVAPSADVVIVGGRDAAPKQQPWRMTGGLQLVLGNAIRVAGQGFDGRLSGKLRLNFEADGKLSGNGELHTADARYRTRGQSLNVTQGRLLYAGEPLDNPVLDITAVRTVGEVEAGVRITGTARKPQIELFSKPAMDDGDILSYLVLGRPMSQATGNDGEVLYQAATSLAIVGGEMLAERIAMRFGLEEVRIETGTTTTDTSLVLGTSLSPRLYIRYIQGLIESTSAVQVRYDLGTHWTVLTESGTRTGNGADLLFKLER